MRSDRARAARRTGKSFLNVDDEGIKEKKKNGEKKIYNNNKQRRASRVGPIVSNDRHEKSNFEKLITEHSARSYIIHERKDEAKEEKGENKTKDGEKRVR